MYDDEIIAKLRRFSYLASILTVAIGLLVMAGWMFDIRVLTSILPNYVTMKPNTAVGLALAGLSLWCWHRVDIHPRLSLAAYLCAVIPFLLGVLTLAEYLLGWNLGIDQLFFKESAQAIGTVFPGRMGANTALCLTLLGTSLFLFHGPIMGEKFHEYLALSAALIGFMGLIGYAFDEHAFYAVVSATQMALHTAAAILLLGIAIPCARPGEGVLGLVVNKSLGGQMTRYFLPVITIAPLSLGWLRLAGQRAGYYDNEFGVCIMILSCTLVLLIITWRIGRALQRTDEERIRLEQESTRERNQREQELRQRGEEIQQINDSLRDQIHQRQQAETAVQASERIYRDFMNGLPVAAYVTDADGRITLYNPAAAALWGRHPKPDDKWCGSHHLFTKDGTPLPHDQCPMAVAIQENRRIQAVETAAQHPDGTRIQFLAYATPFRNDAGVLIGAMNAMVDITERMEAIKAVRESETRLRTIINAEPECIKIISCDGKLLEMNAAGLAMLEADSLNAVIQHGLLEFVKPPFRSPYKQLLEQVIKGENGTLQFEVIGLKGSHRWLEVHAVPLRDDRDKIYAVLGVTRDITRQLQAEIALRDNEERLRLALEAGKMGSWVWDIPENRSFWNHYEYKLLGLPVGTGEVDTNLFFQYVYPEDLPRLRQILQECIDQIKPFKHHFRIVRADGAIRWLSGRGQVFSDAPSGKARQMMGINFDITDSKLADEAMRTSTEQLRLKTEELNTRLRQQEAVATLGEWALQMTDVDKFLNQVIEIVSQFFEANFCKILELQPDNQSLLLRAGCGWHEGLVGTAIVSAGETSQAGYTLQLNRPVIVDDMASEKRFSGPALLHDHGIVSGVSVVIPGRMGPFGVLGTHTRYHYKYNDDDIFFLQSVANIVGDFIERQRLESQYQVLVQGMQDYAIFLISPAGIITTWNTGAENITGYHANESIGQNVALLYTPHDRESGHPHSDLQAADIAGKTERKGWRQRRDGSRFFSHSVTFALRNQAHQLIGYSRILRDITNQEREEGALHSAIDHSVDAVITIADDGIIQSCSGSIHKIFAFDATELIGQNVRILLPEPWRSQHNDSIATYLQTSMAKIIGKIREVEGCRRDGTTFPLELTITEFNLGDTRYFTGIMRDISARKQLEAELRQAQKMEAIGQLAGGIAHDFNNLLSIINGFTDLILRKYALSIEQKNMLEEILNAGNRAANLTRQLLAFSRKQVLAPEILNLNGVINNIEKMLRRLISEDIDLTIRLDPQLQRVKVDPSQMDQILMNLAINARDAMPQGGNLTIATTNLIVEAEDCSNYDNCPPGHYVRLTVSDTGCGMSPEVIAHLFEPFFTTKGLGQGTGLGLATVFGIVKQSDGTISVRSAINSGTTFTILFPPIEEDARVIVAAEKKHDVESGHGETVLLVEDEIGVRCIARLVLEEYGYRVIDTEDGYEAITLIETGENLIHLVITDVVMPTMSGRELADKIRQRFPDIRVLFMSGYMDDALLRYGINSASEAFLQKPFTADDLLKKVRAVLAISPT